MEPKTKTCVTLAWLWVSYPYSWWAITGRRAQDIFVPAEGYERVLSRIMAGQGPQPGDFRGGITKDAKLRGISQLFSGPLFLFFFCGPTKMVFPKKGSLFFLQGHWTTEICFGTANAGWSLGTRDHKEPVEPVTDFCVRMRIAIAGLFDDSVPVNLHRDSTTCRCNRSRMTFQALWMKRNFPYQIGFSLEGN